jgi:periplasmic divalent cation tolerance protein
MSLLLYSKSRTSCSGILAGFASIARHGSSEERVAPSSPVIVLTTLPVSADASAFARTLVGERLAACVAVYAGMQSIYRWKGSVEEDGERQLVIKSTKDRLPALEARVAALHPYDVPEWLVIEPSGASAAYLAWLGDATAAGL